MKKLKQILGVALVATMVLSSCTAEKRVYTKGYNINWYGGKSKVNQVSAEKLKTNHLESLTASSVTGLSDELNYQEMKFRSIELIPSPLTETKTDKKAISASVIAAVESADMPKVVKKTIIRKAKKMNPEAMPESGEKSQVVALILAIVVGGLGIHRFYLGYTWQGVVQLLTLGACGIWSLIDLIRIATGDLGPNGGKYDKTL